MSKTEVNSNLARGYEIKQLPESAVEQAEEIWALAFGLNWVRDYARHELGTIYGAFEKNDLHAISAIVDIGMHFGEYWTRCGGIAAVATMPGQRYQNLVTALLTECVRDLHSRKFPLSALHPFSYPFYEKMGWAVTHWLQEIEISTTALRKLARKGNAKNWRMLPVDRCEETLSIHERMCNEFNLCMRRSPSRARFFAFLPGRRWQYFVHKDGYMLWDLDKCMNGRVYVLEFVYCTEEAYWDGLALLGQMEAQYENAMWYDWSHDKLLSQGISEPRPNIRTLPWMMSRVVHLKEFEKLLPRSLEGLTVYDPLGISAPTEGDISVGELVQLVAGTFKQPDARFPKELHGCSAQRPTWSIERF